MSGVPVEVSARRITVPYLCPCCCGVADTALAVSFTRVTGNRRVRETTREIDFPYCSRCVRHASWWSSARHAAVLVMTCGAAAALVTAIGLGPSIGASIAAIAGAAALVVALVQRTRARAACSADCAGPGPAVTFHGWADNVQRFSFASRRYAAAFAEQNEHSLVNVTPHLYQLIEQHRVAAAPAEPQLEAESASKPWPSAPRIKPPTAPQPVVRARSSSTLAAARSRAGTTAPPPKAARSRSATTVPPPTRATRTQPPTPEPRPAEEEPMPMWPERVDRGRSLLENVMRIDARTLQAGGIVKRPGRLS